MDKDCLDKDKCILIHAIGHKNVSATHKTTLEITTENFLTKTGDCIIAIKADKTMPELDGWIKELLKKNKKVEIEIECGGLKDSLTAYGDSRLTFSDPHAMIMRKSDYVCPRTLCIRADKAAADLDRRLVDKLKEGKPVKVSLRIKPDH